MLRSVEVRDWEKYIVQRGDGYIIYKSPVRCPSNDPQVPEGWECYDCGGAYPYIVVFDPQKVSICWFSARDIARGELNDFLREMGDRVIAILDASVHGCWKQKKNQRVVLVRK